MLNQDQRENLDQLYAAFPSDNKPSFPVETVAFSKCLMFIDDRADVTIINIDNQSLRSSWLITINSCFFNDIDK